MIYSLDGRAPKFPETDYFVAGNATLIGSVTLHRNASVWFNCVLRGDNDELVVGEGSNIQDGSVIHTDPGLKVIIGRNVTVGHMAMLHGCEIGDDTLIGIKAVVLNRARIGRHCIVGANTLIPEGKEIPDGSLVLGSPGRIVRQLGPEEIKAIAVAAEHYIANFNRYLKSLRPCFG